MTISRFGTCLIIGGACLLPAAASAQSAAQLILDEITVTATKKGVAENVQDVPIAVSAFGADQLEAMQFRDLKDLDTTIPNVSFADIGTTKGTANFSIRGVGINSSIPSIDPAVGVFVDGMYLGINTGVILDMFDLESVEILRGPQGILFGRNVTGGAVVVNTKRPGDEFEAAFKAGVESGLRDTGEMFTIQGYVGGPIVEDVLRAKLSVYYSDDGGWHDNDLDNSNFGKSETLTIRPSFVWTPSDDIEVYLRYEHMTSDGDGPAGQNHINGNPFDVDAQVTGTRSDFDFALDERGFYDYSIDSVVLEANFDVDFGDGLITNIFAWRDTQQIFLSDIDSTPLYLLHATAIIDAEQFSNELRYAGRFGDLGITTGVYYFGQDSAYDEIREIAFGTVNFWGGGGQDQTTWGVFAQAEYDITEELSLIVGGRYTYEKKDTGIATVIFNTTACSVIDGTCPLDFQDEETWENFTPKVGLTWSPNDQINAYLSYTQGVRSGGYNFRNTSVVFDPGPFDEETIKAYELGVKARPEGMNARINSAVFLYDYQDMQRELNLADPVAGVVQIIRNTADSTVWGFESEIQWAVQDNFVITGFFGYVNGQYDEVLFDLNGDGLVNQGDEDLEIPRLAPWSYGIGFIYDHDLGDMGAMSLRGNFSHRDRDFYTDSNLGVMNAADMLGGSLTYTTPDGSTSISLYGKNLLNDVTFGQDTQLPGAIGPFALGGTFATLNKGRTVGLELKYSM